MVFWNKNHSIFFRIFTGLEEKGRTGREYYFSHFCGGLLSGTSANKTLTRREGSLILKASFNRRKITAVEDDIICTEKSLPNARRSFLISNKMRAEKWCVLRKSEFQPGPDHGSRGNSGRFHRRSPGYPGNAEAAGGISPPSFYFLTMAGLMAVPLFMVSGYLGNPAGKKSFCLN